MEGFPIIVRALGTIPGWEELDVNAVECGLEMYADRDGRDYPAAFVAMAIDEMSDVHNYMYEPNEELDEEEQQESAAKLKAFFRQAATTFPMH